MTHHSEKFNMRLPLGFLLLAGLLAGCHPQGGGNQAVTSPAADDSSKATSTVADEEEASPSDEPVPAGSFAFDGGVVTPSIEHSVRYDRTQRQVFLEVKNATVEEVIAKVTESFSAAGFAAGKPHPEAGGTRVVFRKRGVKSVFVLFRERGKGPAMHDPDANVSVYLTQQTK